MRIASAPSAMMPVVRKTIHDLDPNQPIYHVQTIEDVVSGSTALQRMTSALLGVFAFVALVLAMIGVYGILAFLVVRRTREIGLRMAVGAQRSDILKLIMGKALAFSAAGIIAGLGLAFLCAHAIDGLLFKATTVDPFSIVLSISIPITIITIAAGVPARRAAMMNPTDSLRAE